MSAIPVDKRVLVTLLCAAEEWFESQKRLGHEHVELREAITYLSLRLNGEVTQ